MEEDEIFYEDMDPIKAEKLLAEKEIEKLDE